ncbi:MAG: S9 family peptidase [Bacteroidales bacterium]
MFLPSIGMATGLSIVDTASKSATVEVNNYLQLGPLFFKNPAFIDKPDINGSYYNAEFLFKYPFFELKNLKPVKDGEWKWNGQLFTWKLQESSVNNRVKLLDSTSAAWTLSCFYLRSESFQNIVLEISQSPAFEVYMDGEKILSQKVLQDTNHAKAQTKSLDIEPGFHVFFIKSLYLGSSDIKKNIWPKEMLNPLQISFTDVEFPLTVGAEVEAFYGMDHYLYGESVYNPLLSYKSEYIALRHIKGNTEKEKYDSWYEIYKTSNLNDSPLEAVQQFTGIFNFSFSSLSAQYAYMKKEGKYTQIYVGKNGQVAKMVYETTGDLSSFAWDPQGRFLILSMETSAEESKNGLKNLSSPADQWPTYRDRISLHKLDLVSHNLIPLTYGYFSTDLMDISRDGRYILFSTMEIKDTMRSYMAQNMYYMNLDSLKPRLLWTSFFSGNAQISPDGKTLMVAGPEYMFTDPNTEGVSLPCDSCFIANDYNIKAFIYNLETGKVKAIAENFDPSWQSYAFENEGKYVYFMADDKDEVNLYAYELASGAFKKIPLELQVLSNFDVKADALVYCGSSADKPSQAFLIKGNAAKLGFTSKGSSFCIANPQKELLENVKIGEYKDWTFVVTKGDSIDATYYLPPNFSASKKYPCIVYYYGGTSPTPKALAMRYPKSVWSSNGYVVLVLQPSGAIGYGREFAARHVNNWGKTVADEIISATRQFCQEHPFVDSTKLGCIGASYGGFMTQLLLTRTNLFAAAISHAGISSISSYWGVGFWGYLYISGATAFSFPWNRKDIYVDQSPLFNADKIHTPLLLLHGTSDHNVPIGESYQMYKALRLLGRPVSMVTVEGEDHGIVGFEKRLAWENTILAWFARYLKGESQWWNSLYPPAME